MNRKFFLLALSLACALLALFVLEVVYGPASMSLAELHTAMMNPASPYGAIFWKLRVPRAVFAVMLGAGLSICGLSLQGIFRNPLADPFTLGLSGGAALGGALAAISGLATFGIMISLGAFFGSLLVCAIVYVLASQSQFSKTSLILGGVIIGYFFQSVLMLTLAVLSSDKAHGVIVWLMGDISSAPPELIIPTLLFCAVGYYCLSRQAASLNLLVLGDEKAISLGEDIGKLRRRVFVWCSVVTGACVAAVGIVGFVGLIVPHVMRRFAGPNHKTLFPLCALAGAAFMLACDLISRVALAPVELPLGVVTGIIGSVFFFWILLHQKRFEM